MVRLIHWALYGKTSFVFNLGWIPFQEVSSHILNVLKTVRLIGRILKIVRQQIKIKEGKPTAVYLPNGVDWILSYRENTEVGTRDHFSTYNVAGIHLFGNW